MVLVMVLLSLIGFALPGSALAEASDSTYTATVESTATYVNPCNGEVVPVTDINHVTIHRHEDAADGSHVFGLTVYGNIQGTGQTTGALYTGVVMSYSTYQVPDPDTFAITYGGNFVLVGQGAVPDFYAHTTNHLTYVNGEIIISNDNTNVGCRNSGGRAGA